MTYLNAKKYLALAPEECGEAEAGSRLKALLAALGDPHRNLKYLRLTGSNGKTICAELLMSAYRSTEYLVGCLIHPDPSDPRFSIRIGGEPLSMDATAALVDRVRQAVSELNLARSTKVAEEKEEIREELIPTRSELFLCMALLAFREAGCRFCLIESDPHKIDATRYLHAPFAAVICGTIPHADRREIQGIRSGISHGIREIVSAPQDREAYGIISDTCAAIHCRLTIPARSEIQVKRLSLRSTEFIYRGKEYRLGLCGRFQITNASVVLETLEMLARMGFPLSHEQITRGLSDTRIPGKFEVLSVSPTIIADSTHSEVAIGTVCESMADFREMIGSSIRLCLPDGNLPKQYREILEGMDYHITQALLLSDCTETEGTVHRFIKKKDLIRAALSELPSDEILLISGPSSFTAAIRYEILRELGF